MVPVSSKFEKYQDIYNRQITRYKKCTKIVLGKCLRLHKRGITLFYTDIDRIYNLMEAKLKTGS